jgi:uncharacterized protein
MLDLYIDADGCPVKDEAYKVAARYGLKVFVVANKRMKIPADPRVTLQVVPGNFDAADDWIAEHVGQDDVVVTADIPLAARCIKKGARVIGTKGREFTEDGIGEALATRELLSNLRQMGEVQGGPAPQEKKDRSRFLSTLDGIIQALRRGR